MFILKLINSIIFRNITSDSITHSSIKGKRQTQLKVKSIGFKLVASSL